MDNGSLATAEPKRLNLGAGRLPVPGFTDVDRKNGAEVYPLPYEDNSIAAIRASHILEHFPHEKVLDVVREWVRVLKPGGVIRIAVPDFKWIAEKYLAGENIDVQGYVMGGHVDANDHHGVIFDAETLTDVMEQVGLRDIRPWKSELKDCAALPLSLNLQGTKVAPLPKLNIQCAMSVPRLGFQDNFFCWVESLLPFGIKPAKYDGAFWGQCLERVMEGMIESDFILTVDYDSVFDRKTVERLIRTAVDHPEADAIVPMQIKRASDHPLLTIMGDDGKLLERITIDEFEKPLTKIHTGHFGLTLIRTKSLKKMPHPWFLGVPNKDGQWGEGRIDDDIHFWKKWGQCGLSIYSANRCVIGHAQLMVTWPNKEFDVIYQNTSDFWDKGPPEGVWQ